MTPMNCVDPDAIARGPSLSCGTEGSNPAPSSGESRANLTSSKPDRDRRDLIHDPRILILEEATSGPSPRERLGFWVALSPAELITASRE